MLKKILSISGKPGLFELLSQGKNCIIVESLTTPRKRQPVFNTEKVMSLGDIAVYTTGEEKPLAMIFESIKEKYNGETVDIKEIEKQGNIREIFAEILPDFDDERVRTSDIKKMFAWYNLLVSNGIDKFVEDEPKEETESTQEENKD